MSDKKPYKRVKLHFPENEGRTRQSFADEANINKIMGRWRRQGFAENVNIHTPVYGDFTTEVDFLQAQQSIKSAEAVFAALPARVRARVNNDPAQLITFVDNPDNHAELVELGLVNPISKEPAPEPVSPEPAVAEVEPS